MNAENYAISTHCRAHESYSQDKWIPEGLKTHRVRLIDKKNNPLDRLSVVGKKLNMGLSSIFDKIRVWSGYYIYISDSKGTKAIFNINSVAKRLHIPSEELKMGEWTYERLKEQAMKVSQLISNAEFLSERCLKNDPSINNVSLTLKWIQFLNIGAIHIEQQTGGAISSILVTAEKISEIKSLKIIGSGEQARIYELDENWAAKILMKPKIESQREEVEIEYSIMQQLPDDRLGLPSHGRKVCRIDLSNHSKDLESSGIMMERFNSSYYDEIKSGKKRSTVTSDAYQVVCGATYFHEIGCMYGDHKPDNLLVKNDKVILCDFGGAIPREKIDEAERNPTQLTVLFSKLHTPMYSSLQDYQALDQIHMNKKLSVSEKLKVFQKLKIGMDKFAIGITLYQMYKGDPDASPYPEINEYMNSTETNQNRMIKYVDWLNAPDSIKTILKSLLDPDYTKRMPLGDAQKILAEDIQKNHAEAWGTIQKLEQEMKDKKAKKRY